MAIITETSAKTQDDLGFYYRSIGFVENEAILIRASKNPSNGKKEKEIIFQGVVKNDGLELFETIWNGRDENKKATYKNTTKIADIDNRFKQLALAGYGIYGYPNHVSGTMADTSAKAFTTLFYEDDHRSLEEQNKRESILEKLGIYVTLKVFSGKKSNHNYIVLNESIESERWKRLNRMLSILMDSDLSVNTFARAMRLPLVYRLVDGSINHVSIESYTGIKYDTDFIEQQLLLSGLFPYGLSEKRYEKYTREFTCRENAGLSRDEKSAKALAWLLVPEDKLEPQRVNNRTHYDNVLSGSNDFRELVETCKSRVSVDDIYSWNGHNFKETHSHFVGCCPNHDSHSRTSFTVKKDTLEWHCFGCAVGGHAIEYLGFLKNGNSKPRGKEFIDILKELCAIANVEFPKIERPQPQRKPYKFDNLSTQKIEDKKEYPRYPKGFGIPTFEVIEFEGSHAEEEQKWADKGYCVVNVSGTGTGKSTATNDLINPDGIDYISSDPQNPKAENVKAKFLPPPSRTQYGRTKSPDGRTVQATIDTDSDKIIEKRNCDYTPAFIEANNKGYPTYDGGKSAFCGNCSVRPECRKTGFLAQWAEYNEKEKYRSLHPSVLSACGDLSQKTGVIDELGSLALTKVIRTNLTDLGTNLLHYEKAIPDYNDPIFYSFIKKVYRVLESLFDSDKGSRYGTKINTVIDALKSQLNDDIIALGDSKDNLIGLLELYGINLHGLVEDGNSFDRNENAKSDHKYSGKANKLLGRRHADETREKIKNAPARVFPSIVKAIFGDNKISLRIAHNELLVTVSCVDDYKVLNNYKYLIIKDSTLSLETINHYGINRPIVFIKKKTDRLPLDGQTIKQYKLHGISSTDIEDIGINRIKLTQKKIEDIIGFQIPWMIKRAWLNDDPKGKRTQSLDGEWYWGKDNRASNEFKDARHMGSIGFPIPNIGATEDEFLVLNDGTYDKEKFDEYLIGKIYNEIVQDMGRQRAALCDAESVHHFITPIERNNKVTNSLLDLSPLEDLGAKIEIIDVFGFCPLAGDENEVTFYRILEAGWQLLNKSIEPTEPKILERMGSNGHPMKGKSGISNAVSRAGYTFKGFITKLRKVHSAYVLTYRASELFDFCYIFPNLYSAWLSEDTTPETDFSDVSKPKVKLLDLVKEAVNFINDQGIEPTPKLVIQWLSENKNHSISQPGLSQCLKRKGVKLADLILSVEIEAEIVEVVDIEDDMGMTAAALDIPDGQNKVNLEGQNSVVDIHTKIALKGDKIKDKVTGEVFTVESFAKGRYHCIDGKHRLSIPFDDAIAA